ncbi:fdxN element excision controlling factor XisI [Geitlerinema sp. FC II]|nr:fdxN element excision controlling factor XisI [Geitlerinema sp. FC II]
MGDERVRGIAICVRLKNQKIWIEEDNTETGIANDLLQKEVPKSDIVLAFHAPKTRKLTGFASA